MDPGSFLGDWAFDLAAVTSAGRVVAAERGHCALDLLPFCAPLPDPQSSTHHFDCQLHGLSGSFVGEHVAQLWDPTHAVAICWMRIIFLSSLARHFFCSTMRPYSLKTGEHHPLSIHKFHVQGTGFEHPSGVLRCIVTSLRECVKGASMGCLTSHNKYVCHKELTFLSLAASRIGRIMRRATCCFLVFMKLIGGRSGVC